MQLPPADQLPEPDHHWTMPELLQELYGLRMDRERMQNCIRCLSRYIPQGMLSPHLHDRAILREAILLMDKPHKLNDMTIPEILAVLVMVLEDYIHGEVHDVGEGS